MGHGIRHNPSEWSITMSTSDRDTLHAIDPDTGDGWTFTLYRPGDPAPGDRTGDRHAVTITPDGSNRAWPYYAASIAAGVGGLLMDMGTGENVPRDVMNAAREWLREVAPWTPTPEQVETAESLPQPSRLMQHPGDVVAPDGDAVCIDAAGDAYRVERDGWHTLETPPTAADAEAEHAAADAAYRDAAKARAASYAAAAAAAADAEADHAAAFDAAEHAERDAAKARAARAAADVATIAGDAFWQAVADHYPAATTGDLAPETVAAFDAAALAAVTAWVAANVGGQA